MPRAALIDEELTRSVIGAFFDVYNTLGYGFLEHVYTAAMERELRARGHRVAREVVVQVTYKGEPLSTHRLDLVVDEKLVIEIKSTSLLASVSIRQLYNYLKATELELGLLLHFGPKPKVYRQILLNGRKARKTDLSVVASPTSQPCPLRETSPTSAGTAARR